MEKTTRGVALAIIMTAAAVCSALAGGSVDPDEVLALAKKDPKLNKELRGRMRAKGGDRIECTTARVGRDVAQELGKEGGERVGNSYDCEVGRSKLKLSVEPEGKGRKGGKSGLNWKWSD